MLDKWKIPLDEIKKELATGQKPKEFVCLGCAAKVELVTTVYPVLNELTIWLKENTKITLQPRDDVYTFETDGTYEINRSCYSIKDILNNKTDKITQDFKHLQPDGIVILANFLPFPSKEKLKEVLIRFYTAAWETRRPFTVGKGHTIQIAKTPDEEYMVVDFIKSKGNRFYAVANNDTISTIDPNLKYASWISVFVSMHNALNDLFLCGVYKNIRLYPSFDARDPDDLPAIKSALEKYKDIYEQYGIQLIDCEPLGFHTKSMGATVIGITDREIPINQRLLPGQILIATRPIGDLAPLTEFLIRQSLEEDADYLQELRLRVLDTMLTPNFEAARIIEKYLPYKGKKFSPEKHITSCRDMSGPGILAIEELAEDSNNDIYLDEIKLHDEMIAQVEMPNPTSGTNGAIITAALADLAKKIMSDLRDAGYDPWVMGEVVSPSNHPKIIINERLKGYPFIEGVNKGIFSKYDFCSPREI